MARNRHAKRLRLSDPLNSAEVPGDAMSNELRQAIVAARKRIIATFADGKRIRATLKPADKRLHKEPA